MLSTDSFQGQKVVFLVDHSKKLQKVVSDILFVYIICCGATGPNHLNLVRGK